MKRTQIFLLCLVSLSLHLTAASRNDLWKKVQEAIDEGRPQTAITNLAPIIEGALRDKAYGEAAKAIARKIVLEGNIQGNKPEEKIRRMEAEILQAPAEIKPLLDTLLANWYWHYYQQNRWRFLQRTRTAEPPGKDFTTWDLSRLFAEIDRVFQRALANADVLKRTAITTFDDLLERGTMPDRYRPTLYDFIGQEALKFYTAGEQAGAKAEDAFELSADAPIFEPAAAFLTWSRSLAEKSLPDSPSVRALRLYADLMSFHRGDSDPTAFVDLDLARLVYGANVAVGDNRSTRYQAALKAFVDQRGDHEVSALACWHWGKLAREENDLVEAHRLAQRGMDAHPQSMGAKLCSNLLAEIEAKSASVATERVWNAPWPNLSVRYRNVTEVHFRIVAWKWQEFLSPNHSRPESLNDRERKELLTRPAVLAWSATLPPTTNYQERVQEFRAPDKLDKGHYFLVASHDPKFGDTDNQLSYAPFWVSDLALVIRPRAGQVEGLVVSAGSGEPRPGAEVEAWYLGNQGRRVAVPKVVTDELGFFRLGVSNAEPWRGYLVRARQDGDELASQGEHHPPGEMVSPPSTQAIFFTDRALYRPGQTIQYKGICLRVDTARDVYEPAANQEVVVVFSDPNGKEVAQARHRCNDYGSFAGSFTAPSGRALGSHSLRVESGATGDTTFNVEEYKRPKFEVTLQAPEVAARLSEKTRVPGKAQSYTGATIDGAQVRWRVVREVQFPPWCWWHPWRFAHGASQEIAHGTATTGVDGTFAIEFVAKPDLAVSPTNQPTFQFSVHADVTDSTGETRSSSRRVQAGYTTLKLNLEADEWQTDASPVALTVDSTTLEGEAQSAKGTVKVYRLKQPETVRRASFPWPPSGPLFRNDGPENPGDPATWVQEAMVEEQSWATDKAGKTTLRLRLSAGLYRVVVESADRNQKQARALLNLTVLQPGATALGLKLPSLVASPKRSVEPGESYEVLWGTGYSEGRAFIEIEHRGRIVERFWTERGRTQQTVKRKVEEKHRGGFIVNITQVRENRGYLQTRLVEVPWSNQELSLRWEHFVSKLEPAQKETWTLVISRDGTNTGSARSSRPAAAESTERWAAELVATLYDASLDQYRGHVWPSRFGVFYQAGVNTYGRFENDRVELQPLRGFWPVRSQTVTLKYRAFPNDLVTSLWGYGWPVATLSARRGIGLQNAPLAAEGVALAASPAPQPEMALMKSMDSAVAGGRAGGPTSPTSPPAPGANDVPSGRTPDLSQVAARKNLQETAFFFPQLLSDAQGVVRLQFTMPEALTRWRFLGFAHDRALRSGLLEAQTVTAKDLMVQPNPPRFLREGDELEFPVKVSNVSGTAQTGKVKLTFANAMSQQPVDRELGNRQVELSFTLPPRESKSFSWRIKVPDGCGFLTYKAVASTGRLSDGEEGYLPVLARRILVTESLPLPIRGKPGGGEVVKPFRFEKLLRAGKSSTLEHVGLTVQMVSRPAWYAVMALPYLMEFPLECSEQTFNRLYANALARHLANRDPRIRRVFDQWKATPALDSPLEKSPELKAVALEETPWLRQAQNESQARRNLGVLFDENRLNHETEDLLRKLTEVRLADGSWPWFPGGRGNDYITLYIVTGFGRLRHLDVDLPVELAISALGRLDAWMDENYRRVRKGPSPDEYVPSATDALYLYGRSFFLKDRPIAKPHQEALDFLLRQSRRLWLQTHERQTQGHLAIALDRFAKANRQNDPTPDIILRSLKERSVVEEELGRYWRETELSWWWYRAPIETQALMIEAFDEVGNDTNTVDECRVWLLKQKQTQDWKTTKATADAIYALLLRGTDLLAGDKLVEVSLGGVDVRRSASSSARSPAVEPGTGFYERRFAGPEVKPGFGDIVVRKSDAGVSWGSVHWQYLEDMTKVTPYAGTPLKLTKSLFRKVNTARGQELQPAKEGLAVGDELVVRIELRTDRDMEYVHLKDQRGSGTEPVSVLSRYRYQDGLAYYETTRDTASHFFIDYLPKGTYVFEYATRVQHRGRYQTGLASIQCMYAPEFNSHSESLSLLVK